MDRPLLIPLYGVGHAGGLLLIVWLATLSPLFLVPGLGIPVAAGVWHTRGGRARRRAVRVPHLNSVAKSAMVRR